MFYHIKGTITDMEPGMAVIECGGVGFAVNTSANTLSQLRPGTEAKLYISEQVREDAFELYGFYTLAEKHCFEMLTSVSGVGPKAAVSILSSNTPEGVCMAVMSGNEKALTVAAGIGKKIAQRVILELKDKISKQAGDFALPDTGFTVPAGDSAQNKMADAASALGVLGYSSAESAAALKGVDQSLPLEEIIRAGLRNMMK
ncbi:MAG: Holliday junction branch migration protein RuvA [Oscillospiraceae bacterium]